MLPVWNESFRTSLLSVRAAFFKLWTVLTRVLTRRRKAFFKLWTVLTLVGLLLYVALALSVFISRQLTWSGVMAVACVTTALAVLLMVEEGSNDSGVGVANMTLAGCVYLLLVKHKIALGIAVFTIAGGVAGAYYIISSLVRFEYQGSTGTLVVKLPGQTVYYRPLQPYGWENTQIELKAKQRFEVEITGRISPGLGREIALMSAEWQADSRKPLKLLKKEPKLPEKVLRAWSIEPKLPEKALRTLYKSPQLPRKVLWEFSGPEGYNGSFYDRVRMDYPHIPHYSNDDLLTVKGRPHNQVIGVIVTQGESPCYKRSYKERSSKDSKDQDQPCTGNDVTGKPGYNADDTADAGQLYFLSKSNYDKPLEIEARKSGILWLTVNDADPYRYDNVGLFFVKVTISRW